MLEKLNEHILDIPCPGCGAKNAHSIGWIKENDHFICACGARVNIDKAGLLSGIEEAERALNDFQRSLRQMGFKSR
ncbi:hypothetical protein [Rhodomicrobium lacus]|uniref:hypothetical protein n=1 Tax=Rhodomicrobium lacus TaxID=2498452 RepID=UPI0026E37BF3|nr:hypothetical protein [Rhodomicrobium lacus]WKW51891.1 hypothetical protein QMO75_05270 [Rhodomicrobium lacus]